MLCKCCLTLNFLQFSLVTLDRGNDPVSSGPIEDDKRPYETGPRSLQLFFIDKSLVEVLIDTNHDTNGCFQKKWYSQIIHFNRVFPYKPSNFGVPLFLETPKSCPRILESLVSSFPKGPYSAKRVLRMRFWFLSRGDSVLIRVVLKTTLQCES